MINNAILLEAFTSWLILGANMHLHDALEFKQGTELQRHDHDYGRVAINSKGQNICATNCWTILFTTPSFFCHIILFTYPFSSRLEIQKAFLSYPKVPNYLSGERPATDVLLLQNCLCVCVCISMKSFPNLACNIWCLQCALHTIQKCITILMQRQNKHG